MILRIVILHNQSRLCDVTMETKIVSCFINQSSFSFEQFIITIATEIIMVGLCQNKIWRELS